MPGRADEEIAHAIVAQTPAVHYRQGKVIGTDPLTITLGDSDVPISGVAAIGSYAPAINETVHVLRYADTALVLGASL